MNLYRTFRLTAHLNSQEEFGLILYQMTFGYSEMVYIIIKYFTKVWLMLVFHQGSNAEFLHIKHGGLVFLG